MSLWAQRLARTWFSRLPSLPVVIAYDSNGCNERSLYANLLHVVRPRARTLARIGVLLHIICRSTQIVYNIEYAIPRWIVCAFSQKRYLYDIKRSATAQW